MAEHDPLLEKCASECIDIVRRKFRNCSVSRNKTNDDSISITFNDFETKDGNSEYYKNGKYKNEKTIRKMPYVYHSDDIQKQLQLITKKTKNKVLFRIILTKDERGKFIKSITIHIKKRGLFQRHGFSRFDKLRKEDMNIQELLEQLKTFEEEYNIYNEGFFSKKQPVSLKEATSKLKEQIKQLRDQGYDFAHVNWIKHNEPDTYNYYEKEGLITKIDDVYCFIKGTREDIKSVNVYLVNKQDMVIVKRLKFR